MNRRYGKLLALALLPLLMSAGCLARQVKRDGIDMRQTVIQLYADQAMDNLVSAYENKPFVQVAYSKILVNDTDTAKTSGGIEQSVDETHPLGTAALAKFTRVFKNIWNLGEDLTRSRKLSYWAEPVTNADDVYEAYIQFAKDPNLFVATREPPKCDVHIQKKCHGCYYWVPAAAAPAFQELVLRTALLRGQDTIVGYRERRCVGLRLIGSLGNEGDRFWIDFDAPVPNGASTLVVILADGRKYKQRALKDAKVKDGAPVSALEVQLVPDSPLRDSAVGSVVRVYSDLYPPEVLDSNGPVPAAYSGVMDRSLDRLRQAR